MKLVASIKILPTPEQNAVLTATLERCNAACTWLAQTGFDSQTFRQFDLHKFGYQALKKRFGLTAQASVRSIAKVADAFKINRDVAPVFRLDAAQPYDDRIIRFTKDGRVNLWTVEGRMTVDIVIGEHQKRLMIYRKGEVDLCFIRGKWFLNATCDVPETEEFNVEDWLGVDMGIVALVATSDGDVATGAEIERRRHRIQKRRRGLQKCGTRCAKRRLRILSGKQRRYQTAQNHIISKALVGNAQRTGRGIAIERLKGIRERVSAKGSDQRARLGNWAFGQLGDFLTYKSRLAGVPLVCVNPRNTSRQCAECGCIDKRNRSNQTNFKCVGCLHEANADLNAARVIRQRAILARGVVNHPEVLAA